MEEEFKRSYEPVFSVDKNSEEWDALIKKFTDKGWNPNSIVEHVEDTMKMYSHTIWDAFVRIFWLRQTIMEKLWKNGRFVGHKTLLALLQNSSVTTISEFECSLHYRSFRSYAQDLLPKFYESNPFENPEDYAFPYEWISPDFLIPITFYERRLILLDRAEERKFTFAEFMDDAINDVLSFNEHIGEDRYVVSEKDKNRGMYIRKTKETSTGN